MIIIVTNNPNVKNDNYEIITFDEFLKRVNSDEGLDADEGLYIDVAAITDEEIYQTLIDTGAQIEWVVFNDDELPDWFDSAVTPTPQDLQIGHLSEEDSAELADSLSLMDKDENEDTTDEGGKIGKIITFGSPKGGSGKTFTTIITAVYYAKDHPNEKVCLLDLDIEEPQIGIVIKHLTPTVKSFYTNFLLGNTDFESLYKCRCNDKVRFPENLDFYLSPREVQPVQDENFWQCVMSNLFLNYDMVFIDTGTTYMVTPAISSAYRVADKINIVAMANLASTVTVGKQIKRLTGEAENDVFSKDDGLESKLNLIITNAYDDKICNSIVAKLEEECPIIAKFGNLSQKINQIQVLSQWDMFDDNVALRESMKHIYAV